MQQPRCKTKLVTYIDWTAHNIVCCDEVADIVVKLQFRKHWFGGSDQITSTVYEMRLY